MESFKNTISYELKEHILGAIIVSALLILLSGLLAHEKKSETVVRTQVAKNISQSEALERADYHLKTADMNRIIQQFKTELENRRTADQILLDRAQGSEDVEASRYGIQLDQEYGAADVGAYLEQTAPSYDNKLNVRDRIESQIARQKFLKEYDEKYEKEFVNQFIQNMEQAGYEVQINDKLQVVRVRKIAQPDSLKFD